MSAARVFISATSSDLTGVRKIAKDALLAIDHHPIEQIDFPPDYRSIREMLRAKIKFCDAVVHIVGRRYGSEPDPNKLPKNTPRRSYTQMEYDTARELKKKVYVFVCPADFPYDDGDSSPESDELRTLQNAHRQAVLNDERMRQKITDGEDLALKLRQLQENLDKSERRVSRLFVLLFAVSLAVAGLGYGVFRLSNYSKQLSEAVLQPEVLAQRLKQNIEEKADLKLAPLRNSGADFQKIDALIGES